MDPGTGLTILGTTIGSAKLLEKLLGPTAEYIGNNVRDYTEKGLNNLARIFNSAIRQSGESIHEHREVPPKVLKNVLNDGYFCEDELSSEYFGGVLASSRSSVRRDDRGAGFIALLGKLSTYQIRAHYVIYSYFKQLYDREQIEISVFRELRRNGVYIPAIEFGNAMDFASNEDPNIIIPHIGYGLTKEYLINSNWLMGGSSVFSEFLNTEKLYDGVFFVPSAFGIELFLWANGLGNFDFRDFLDPGLDIQLLKEVTLPNGAERLINTMPFHQNKNI